MNENILYYLMNHAGSLTLQELLLNFAAAIITGGIIFLSYRFSHSGAVYSKRFNVSLWMMTVVSTMVMCVIGNNIALSLGMVGALSIVRFRTAIKDARDTGYIFWTVAAGICCGISDFMTALIGSVVIFLLMLFIGNAQSNVRYLLIVRGEEAMTEEVSRILDTTFRNKIRLCVKNRSHGAVEYIYELSEKLLRKYESEGVEAQLASVPGVAEVNLVGQNETISE